LEDPGVIQAEIDRRRDTAQRTDPLKHREDTLHRDEMRLATTIERLVTAYQEGLMTLAQLRGRIPQLRKRQQGVQAELQSLAAAATDETRYLRLVETLADFRTRLHARAQTLDIRERQKILRLVANEIVVGRDTITIRHSIPVPDADPEPTGGPRPPPDPSRPKSGLGYLLRSGSQDASLRSASLARHQRPLRDFHRRCEPALDVQENPRNSAMLSQSPQQQLVVNIVEQTLDVELDHPVIVPASPPHQRDRVQSRPPRAIAK